MSNPGQKQSIDRINISDLCRQKLSRAQPRLVDGIKATNKPWTPEYVVERVGDTVVPVHQISGGAYVGSTRTNMSVRDYYEDVTNREYSGPMPYLAELSYDKHFPALANELVDSPQLRGERPMTRVMYFGHSVHSQIHYHIYGSAMLFCLYGRKTVRLYAPDQTPNLYKTPKRNFSEVLVSSNGENTYDHDRKRFPKFDDAQYMECVVSPGDVLFIPVYWWHGIQNFDDLSLTAVYFWRENWHGTWREWLPDNLPPVGMRSGYMRKALRGSVERNLPQVTRMVRNRRS